ncbi:MAG TPA: hypothetical protein VLV83_08170, partial [Acidobacteriota bacterium]|nr:hypothetical protein [Acidobacteriota bacterium]
AAVRTEERIAKLMGSDSATAFKVEVEQTNDKLEVLKMMEQMFGAPHTSHGPAIPGEVVPTTTEPRKRRPLQTDSVATTNTNKPNTPPNEFPDAIPAHEVQEEAVTIAEDIEPTPQPQPRRKRKTPDTTSHLLRDYDD